MRKNISTFLALSTILALSTTLLATSSYASSINYNYMPAISKNNISNLTTKIDQKWTISKIKDVDLSEWSSSAIVTDSNQKDHLLLWGNNEYYELGNSNTNDIVTPQELVFKENTIKTVSLGAAHSGVVTVDQNNQDHIYMWGSNSHGQIGNNTLITQFQPVEIETYGLKIKDLKVAEQHSVFVGTDQAGNDYIYTWGSNYFGQLGDKTYDDALKPKKISIPETKISKLEVGDVNTGVLTVDQNNQQHLYIWGWNYYFQLGITDISIEYLNTPNEIFLPGEKIKDFDLGPTSAGAVVTDKNNHDVMYMWGNNLSGQLGTGGYNLSWEPLKVELLETNIKMLDLGSSHSGAVTIDENNYQHLYMWGLNGEGELGNGLTGLEYFPRESTVFEETYQELNLGGYHSAAITKNFYGKSHLLIWGYNNYGQIGDNHEQRNRLRPFEILSVDQTI